jgi:hypothetical protein
MGLAREPLSGHAMVCSLRYSLQGSGRYCITLPYELASHFPQLGQASQATGTLHCPTSNFSRVAQTTLLCNTFTGVNPAAGLQLLKGSSQSTATQGRSLWKPLVFCGKHAQPRLKNPRSVSPFTKNCIASATSNRPMIRTRMRMPVSPSTDFTLPAPASTQ